MGWAGHFFASAGHREYRPGVGNGSISGFSTASHHGGPAVGKRMSLASPILAYHSKLGEATSRDDSQGDLPLASASLCLALYWHPIPSLVRRRAATIVKAPYILLRILGYFTLALSLIYIACIILALIQGWALPTTALIRGSSVALWLAVHEPKFGFALLTCAALGAVATWFALLVPEGNLVVQQEEATLLRFFRVFGFLIVACVFVFSISAMWAGIVRPGDLDGVSIGGLIPFNDAGGYMAGATDEAKTGLWSAFMLRRPLAAAFRTTLLFFSGYSYPGMLFIQACLLAAVSCFATRAVMHWRGLWAGIAFFGLAYTYTRSFVPTALTEPLGLFWAFFSIPFLIEALKSRSLVSALVGLGATTMALMTRMGAMFTIPALVIWIMWQFGRNRTEKLAATFAAGMVVISILSANALVSRIYRSGPDVTGENFSYTLCGLAIGTAWDGCPKRIQEEGQQLPAHEAAMTRLMYSMAWQNFKTQPDVLIARLISASYNFVLNLPDTMFGGYEWFLLEPRAGIKNAISLVSIAGLIYLLTRRQEWESILFWALFWLSTVASAAIVYFDDGGRVLAVSYVFISLFFALGFSSPTASSASDKRSLRKLNFFGISFFAFIALLFFGIPWLAFTLSPTRHLVVNQSSLPGHEAAVLGGRRISGVPRHS